MHFTEPPSYTSIQQERIATAQRLVDDWYPKINVLLFGSRHPLPYPKPHIKVEESQKYVGVPAYTEDDTIYFWGKYIESQDEEDFEGMVIHELTHINQHGKDVGENGWVVEGVADYFRHKYFAKDIQSTLSLTVDGRLFNYMPKDIYFYNLQQQKVDLRHQGYQYRYTVASTFLYWLEQRKDSQIVKQISAAFEQGKFTPQLFESTCGKPLDVLWTEFVAESQRTSAASSYASSYAGHADAVHTD